jgi:hypothetical protein
MRVLSAVAVATAADVAYIAETSLGTYAVRSIYDDVTMKKLA